MRSNRKRRRPKDVFARLRRAGEVLTKGTPIAEVAKTSSNSEVILYRQRVERGCIDRNELHRQEEMRLPAINGSWFERQKLARITVTV